MELNKEIMTKQNSIEEDEIDLMDLIKVIWKNKKIIIGTTLIITILAIVFSLNQKSIYKSELTFTEQNSSSSGGLASLASSIPFASLAGMSSGNDGLNLLVIMESRGFRKGIVKKLNLFDYYIEKNEIDLSELEEENKPDEYDIVVWLKNLVTIAKDEKTGVYTVDIEMDDPEMATKIANIYFYEMEEYLKEKNMTASKKNKKFIGEQLRVVEKKLKEQEENLKAIEEKYNTVSILDEAKAVTEILASLKKNILELNAKLKVASEFAGMQNIEVKKLQKEIEVYKEQIKALEEGGENVPVNLIALKNIPNIKIKMTRLQREVEATVSVYKMLLQQYETAKIDEVKESNSINILDEAIVPEIPIKPNKKLNVIIGFVLGGFLGIFIAFFKEFVKGIDWSVINE